MLCLSVRDSDCEKLAALASSRGTFGFCLIQMKMDELLNVVIVFVRSSFSSAALASTASNEMKMLHDKRTTTDSPPLSSFPRPPLPHLHHPRMCLVDYFLSFNCLRPFLSCKFTFAFLVCTLFVSTYVCVCVCVMLALWHHSPSFPPPPPSGSACVCLCFYVIYLFKSISLSVFEHFVAICFRVCCHRFSPHTL